MVLTVEKLLLLWVLDEKMGICRTNGPDTRTTNRCSTSSTLIPPIVPFRLGGRRTPGIGALFSRIVPPGRPLPTLLTLATLSLLLLVDIGVDGISVTSSSSTGSGELENVRSAGSKLNGWLVESALGGGESGEPCGGAPRSSKSPGMTDS